jgi:hypothetical protein
MARVPELDAGFFWLSVGVRGWKMGHYNNVKS